MAWWQKKLLRFALSRTGLLEEDALNLDDLDIKWGRQNVLDLKNVRFNIDRITTLLQLPPNLRVEVAQVLSLRLTIPADIYRSSIIAELDGVEVAVGLNEPPAGAQVGAGYRSGRQPHTRTPQHRKVHQRIPSTSSKVSGSSIVDDDTSIPTTEELARSFLLGNRPQERRELEASIVAEPLGMQESFTSENSDDAYGTGISLGLPGFLAGFLQGVIDRLELVIKNVEVKLSLNLHGKDFRLVPVTLLLRVGNANLKSVVSNEAVSQSSDNSPFNRQLRLEDISFEIMSESMILEDLPTLPPYQSPANQSKTTRNEELGASLYGGEPTTIFEGKASSTAPYSNVLDEMESTASFEPERSYVDSKPEPQLDEAARGDDFGSRSIHSDLEIRPGDDNISWGSRRSRSSTTAEDLWNSQIFEEELPDSLLLERVSTPRAFSGSREGSSPAPPSLYKRSIPKDSPGKNSWPFLEDRLQDTDPLYGHSSWPVSSAQPPTISPESDLPFRISDPLRDLAIAQNATTSIDAGSSDMYRSSATQKADTRSSQISEGEDDMSMYMSAMSYHSAMDGTERGSTSVLDEHNSFHNDYSERNFEDNEGSMVESSANIFEPDQSPVSFSNVSGPGDMTPRTLLPSGPTPTALPETPPPTTLSLLHISSIELLIPTTQVASGAEILESASTGAGSTTRRMPGTFSMYSEGVNPLKQSVQESSFIDENLFGNSTEIPGPDKTSQTRIDIGSVDIRLDVSSARLLSRTASVILISMLQGDQAKRTNEQSTTNGSSIMSLNLGIASLRIGIDRSRQASSDQSGSDGNLFSIKSRDINLQHNPLLSRLRIRRLEAFIGSNRLLSFDQDQEHGEIGTEVPDITLDLTKASASNLHRICTYLKIQTRPLRVLVDVPGVEEVFDLVGGMSGILEIGNSVLVESVVASSSSSPTKSQRGVHFPDDPQPKSYGSELKIDLVVDGVEALLQAESCYLQCRTLKMKAIYRDQGLSGASIPKITLSGPHLRNEATDTPSVQLCDVRLEYASGPQSKDLESLLSLLTPSKDKYDNDDDILVDTLLRQRKKGALFRVNVGTVDLSINDLDHLTPLTHLGDELTKLSAVAKYLPEDERPGILTMLRVKEIKAGVFINSRFGRLKIQGEGFHCAQVGLPSLLALSIGNVTVGQDQNTGGRTQLRPLVHALVPPPVVDGLPMVMVRTLGNEMEPLVKVKLFNVCLEYSVPVLLALMNKDSDTNTEQITVGLANSLASLVDSPRANALSSTAVTSKDSDSAKPTRVELIVHDSAIGLSPQSSQSKALLALSDVHIATMMPRPQGISLTIEIRKAAIFLTDDIDVTETGSLAADISQGNPATKARLQSALAKQGFVSVGSIMATVIKAGINGDADDDQTSVDVNISSQLLLLETCADSTQTLIAVLTGLAPPQPANEKPKYLEEPMTIDDMMASFSGEPYVERARASETLFDVEEEPGQDTDTMFDVTQHDYDPDDLLAESELSSSLYGPISGILDDVDMPSEDDMNDDLGMTAESLLEDDPFEMPSSPTSMRLSDAALVRELKKQCQTNAGGEEAVDLGICEFDDIALDTGAAGQSGLAPLYRSRDTLSGRLDVPGARSPLQVPLKLKLSDLHIIWNIYDGYDWRRTREGITEAVERVELKAEERKARQRQLASDREDEDSAIGDFLFNSIYIGVPSSHDVHDLRREINRGIDDMASETESVPMSGMSRQSAYTTSRHAIRPRSKRRLKLERSRSHKIAFELKGLSVDFLVFPPDSKDIMSSIDVRIKDFEIFDNVSTSTWRKFLTPLENGPDSREMSKPMIHLEVFNIRTLEHYAAAEISLHVTILPLRLHVDQDALDFITRFFEFKDKENQSSKQNSEQPFLQRVEVETVDLCLDYKPKKVDYAGLRSGHTTEFMNFIILDAANIRLKHAIIYGIKGFEPLHKTLNDVWMPDVRRNQLPTVLAGLAPVRSLVNIGTGVRDVVAIPIREYQKDGRIIRSIQKGAFHFGKTTTAELARLGAKVAIGTQNLLHGAEEVLSASPHAQSRLQSNSPKLSPDGAFLETEEDHESTTQRTISAYADQPIGVFSGLRSARRYLERDLLSARDALIAVQGEVLQSTTPGDAAAAVAKHAPTIIIRPIAGVSRAVGTSLLGVSNQIDRRNLQRVDDVSALASSTRGTPAVKGLRLTVLAEIQKEVIRSFR